MLLISFLALFASIFFLQLGNSILAPFDVLVGLNVDFTNFEIGLLGSSHFLGFLTGCWIVPFIMARVGHIRAFTIFALTIFLLAAWRTWQEVEKASAGSFQNNLYLNDKGHLISNKMVKERLKEIA